MTILIPEPKLIAPKPNYYLWRCKISATIEKIVKAGTSEEYFEFVSRFTKRMEIRQIVSLTAIFSDQRSDLIFGLIDKKIINPTWSNAGNLLYWYSSSSQHIWDGLEKRGVPNQWESSMGRNLWFSAIREPAFCEWLESKNVPSDKKDKNNETWWFQAVKILDASQLISILPYAKLSETHFFNKDNSGETALTALLGNRVFCSPEFIRSKSIERPEYTQEIMTIVDAHLKINPALLNEPGARGRTPIIMAVRSYNYALVEHLYRLGANFEDLMGKTGDAKLLRHINARLTGIEDKELRDYADRTLERTRIWLKEENLRLKVGKMLPLVAASDFTDATKKTAVDQKQQLLILKNNRLKI